MDISTTVVGPVSSDVDTKKNSSIGIWIFVGVSICIFFVSVIIALTVTGEWISLRSWVNRFIVRSEYVTISNQVIGESITVDAIRLKRPGFVTIAAQDIFGKAGESLLGASDLLPAGIHRNITIRIHPVDYIDPERTALPFALPGMRIYATVWHQDQTDVFSGAESVSRDIAGYPIFSTFVAL